MGLSKGRMCWPLISSTSVLEQRLLRSSPGDRAACRWQRYKVNHSSPLLDDPAAPTPSIILHVVKGLTNDCQKARHPTATTTQPCQPCPLLTVLRIC